MGTLNGQRTRPPRLSESDGGQATVYDDPIQCPFCRKVFGEWELVQGRVVIKKWCPACKKMVYIKKP